MSFVLVPLLEILKENADFIKREDFSSCLEKIGSGGVEKFLSAQDFIDGKF